MLQPCVALIEVCSSYYSVYEVGWFCTSVSIGPVNCHMVQCLLSSVPILTFIYVGYWAWRMVFSMWLWSSTWKQFMDFISSYTVFGAIGVAMEDQKDHAPLNF